MQHYGRFVVSGVPLCGNVAPCARSTPRVGRVDCPHCRDLLAYVAFDLVKVGVVQLPGFPPIRTSEKVRHVVH